MVEAIGIVVGIAVAAVGIIPVIAVPVTVIAVLVAGDECVGAENVSDGREAVVCLVRWGGVVDGGVHVVV